MPMQIDGLEKLREVLLGFSLTLKAAPHEFVFWTSQP